MAYIGNSPGVASQRITTTLTATSGQTTFTPTSGYTVGYIDVYQNGVKLVNGEDYTASNGTSVVLTVAASENDVVETVAYLPRGLSDGYTKAEADARYMSISEETLPSQTGQSGKYLTTDGTNASWATVTIPDEVIVSASEPSGVSEGQLWYDATNNILMAYDGTEWNTVSTTPSKLTSVSGTIYTGLASSLTLSGEGFLDDDLVVNFTPSGGSTTSVTVTPSNDTAATVAVPSAIYNLSGGTSVGITVTNSDGRTSGPAVSISVVGLPTGGTITTSGGYRYHTFTSSSNLVVPTGFSATAEYLLVAGGGGSSTGGGGAGGAIDSTVSLSAQTYPITIGAGGSGAGAGANGSQGSSSTAFGNTAVGGGYGGRHGGGTPGGSGGSGGGGGTDNDAVTRASGTAGQGNSGGKAIRSGYGGAGGGGGKGAAGDDASNESSDKGAGGNGGVGINWKSLGTYYAGGGGGGGNTNSSPVTYGGLGGLGGGGNGTRVDNGFGAAGTVNTGGGAGGGDPEGGGAAGGSGIAIIRYQIS
jgi:hypothetical protein